ncbi:MAG: tyrosine-type recombinase/integrase [Phycisphaera sp.]|nr:tyrosine-type recombinase/integrase [Phycisphaera sp.]
MKLIDRERVDGSTVTIGHRVQYRDGKQVVSRSYSAEYRDLDGKQKCESLKTRSRLEARRKAVTIYNELLKGERFVPIHPKVRKLLDGLPKKDELVFPGVNRKQLNKLKDLCVELKFPKPRRFKLHSFRHHFASLCANHNIAYKKALTWLGHSSSEMLDIYYHLHDAESQAAMMALAQDTGSDDDAEEFAKLPVDEDTAPAEVDEGDLRANAESTIENLSKDEWDQQLLDLLEVGTKNPGLTTGACGDRVIVAADQPFFSAA